MTRLWMADDSNASAGVEADAEPVTIDVDDGFITLTLWDGRTLQGSATDLLSDVEGEVLADNRRQDSERRAA